MIHREREERNGKREREKEEKREERNGKRERKKKKEKNGMERERRNIGREKCLSILLKLEMFCSLLLPSSQSCHSNHRSMDSEGEEEKEVE